MVLAGVQAQFRRHGAAVNVLGKRNGTSQAEIVRVASQRHVVGNGGRVDGRKGRILVDGQTKVAAADFRLVAGACVRALALIRHWAVDAVTAVALAVVLEAGVAKVVSW